VLPPLFFKRDIMEYVFSFVIDPTLDAPKSYIKAMASKALQYSKLKAPIKTGKLRRSIKYKQYDDEIILYIDKAMFGSVPYYEYVNEAPKKDGSPRRGNGFWNIVVDEFGSVFYANVDKRLKEQLKKAREEAPAVEVADLRQVMNETKKQREKTNETRSQALSLLAYGALFNLLEVEYATQ